MVVLSHRIRKNSGNGISFGS